MKGERSSAVLLKAIRCRSLFAATARIVQFGVVAAGLTWLQPALAANGSPAGPTAQAFEPGIGSVPSRGG